MAVVPGGREFKDDNTVGKVSRHDKVVLDNEERLEVVRVSGVLASK